jgi:hypothetical protein
MNKCCVDCFHSIVPASVKKKFNMAATRIFNDECPLDDSKVVGCLTKTLKVDWLDFTKFLKSKDMITEEEHGTMLELFSKEDGI